jgi:hypothetical protein
MSPNEEGRITSTRAGDGERRLVTGTTASSEPTWNSQDGASQTDPPSKPNEMRNRGLDRKHDAGRKCALPAYAANAIVAHHTFLHAGRAGCELDRIRGSAHRPTAA